MITVGLPLYKSKNIAWIALESLARQQNIDFEWELVVIEEKESAFGKEKVLEYREKLNSCGCKEIKYIELDNHIALSKKWLKIAEIANNNSLCLVLQAGDDYSQPYRLKESFDICRSGIDWVQNRYAIYYNLFTKKTLLYDWKNSEPLIGHSVENMIHLKKFHKKF